MIFDHFFDEGIWKCEVRNIGRYKRREYADEIKQTRH